jgi:hypothetical protein
MHAQYSYMGKAALNYMLNSILSLICNNYANYSSIDQRSQIIPYLCRRAPLVPFCI